MPFEDTKILEFKKYQNFDKAPSITYADFECIIEKIDGCRNNPEKSSTAKVSEHILSGFPMFTILSFRSIENKHNVYRERDCMINIFEFLREHAMAIINFKTKKNKLVTKEQRESYENAKILYLSRKIG